MDGCQDVQVSFEVGDWKREVCEVECLRVEETCLELHPAFPQYLLPTYLGYLPLSYLARGTSVTGTILFNHSFHRSLEVRTGKGLQFQPILLGVTVRVLVWMRWIRQAVKSWHKRSRSTQWVLPRGCTCMIRYWLAGEATRRHASRATDRGSLRPPGTISTHRWMGSIGMDRTHSMAPLSAFQVKRRGTSLHTGSIWRQ